MLMPKRVKRRKQFRGSMAGKALRGNTISNVMLLVNGKATRVGFKMDGDKKVRVAKATGAVID